MTESFKYVGNLPSGENQVLKIDYLLPGIVMINLFSET